MSWTDPSASRNTNFVWLQLSGVTDLGDYDFVLRVSDQYPLLVSDETARALPVYESVISNP